jgi:hydrogenase/urease accessory protein HupE
LWAITCHAHDPGLSTATVRLTSSRLEVVLVFAGADAAEIAGFSRGTDGKQALSSSPQGVAALRKKAPDALEVNFDDKSVAVKETRCRFDGSDNATVYLEYPVPSFSTMVIRSKWLSVLPPGHRQFFTLQDADDRVLTERMLSANTDTVTIEAEPSAPRINSFADFLVLGVKHIWTGYDHLLFLFGLLIVTRNFSSSVKIITCFTLAHSITLAVATLSLVQISSRYVEPLIAVSIVYVGVENLLRGDDPKGRWLLTFAFGLIHGFGFASVLRELGVGANGTSIAVPLVSFNLGVELGQLVIAGLALPIIWRLRARPMFLQRWVPACSVLVAALGSYWFVQRVWFLTRLPVSAILNLCRVHDKDSSRG